jgi:hypothetical protein
MFVEEFDYLHAYQILPRFERVEQFINSHYQSDSSLKQSLQSIREWLLLYRPMAQYLTQAFRILLQYRQYNWVHDLCLAQSLSQSHTQSTSHSQLTVSSPEMMRKLFLLQYCQQIQEYSLHLQESYPSHFHRVCFGISSNTLDSSLLGIVNNSSSTSSPEFSLLNLESYMNSLKKEYDLLNQFVA